MIHLMLTHRQVAPQDAKRRAGVARFIKLRYHDPRYQATEKRYLMRIYDVSVPISARTPTYPGDPGIDIRQWLSLADGDVANVTALHFGAHTGTHVDAPAHFLK